MSTINFNDQYFPDHEILGKLGQSNAHVIKARHRATGEVVAIKHFPFNIDEGTLRRFRRESDLMTSLDHPNIVGIRSYHLDAELPHLVMEWVEGGDLRSLLKADGTLPVPEVIRLGLQMTEVLRIIHERGIIHRDIKPENILYRRLKSGEHQYLLTDFGISRLRGQGRSTGITSMTYEYASPENFYDEENLSEASDFYSLGVVLYECLAGTVPYPLGSRGIGALMDSVRNSPLPPIEKQAEYPPSLVTLIRSILIKEPKKRLIDNTEIRRTLKKADWENEENIYLAIKKIEFPKDEKRDGEPKLYQFQLDAIKKDSIKKSLSIAENYIKNQAYEEAIPILEDLVISGSTEAMNSLARLYQNGLGTLVDTGKAFELYKKSANAGNPIGQYNVGYMYQNGLGIPKSLRAAFMWYTRAAEQGNDAAMVSVGFFHYHGLVKDKDKDYIMASVWFRKAAKKGNAWGYYNLGIMYEKGNSVDKSKIEAIRLYRLAASKGLNAAKDALERLK